MRRSSRTSVTTTGGGSTGGLRPVDGRRPPRGGDRGEKTAARSRRRFARRQWRRRWLTWKPLLVLVLALAVGIGGVWLVFFSSVLALEDVRVTGATTIPVEQVVKVADVDKGRPLATVDTDRIVTRVGALGPVRSVVVRRSWPHGLVIEVQERVPVAVVSIAGQLRSLDAEGVVFGSYAQAPAGLPRIESTTGTSSGALKEAATVVAAIPSDLASRVDHVEVETIDQITLALKDGRRVEWGSSADSALKAEVLGKLLSQEGKVYDVSVPGKPTVTP